MGIAATGGSARPDAARGELVQHRPNHHWVIAKGASKKQRKLIYRTIIAHARWVIAHRGMFSKGLLELHVNQLMLAKARLRRLVAPRALTGWTWADVTTYSVTEPGSSTTGQGCVDRGLRDSDLTFAARDYQVPCFGKIQFCYHGRCAIGSRTDSSGPGVASSSFDLNYGLARAIRLPEIAHGGNPGGHATVRWRRMR